MTLLIGLFLESLHIALMLAAAPVLAGLLAHAEARFAGRNGPPILQPWHDLRRLIRKQPVLAENASALFRAAPLAGFAATATAAALVPSFSLGMATAPCADLLVIAGLLAAARIAPALGAMDVGTAAGGLDASRAISVAVRAGPALLLVFLTLALLAGSTNLDGIAEALRDGPPGPRVALGLALLATLIIARADTGPPVSALEYGGAELALIDATVALRRLLWLDLMAAIFLPFGIAPAGAGPVAWVIGLAAWLLKILALAAVLALVDAAAARTRLPRRAEWLGVAMLLGLLAAGFVFLGTGLA
jgi:formate hydrogenlyase subunit 4